MKHFADASFLISFCVRDKHRRKARECWEKLGTTMYTNRLAYFEAENAIRVLRVGRSITPEEELEGLEKLKRAVLEGFVEIRDVSIKRIHAEARRISLHNTNQRGFGAMDILHIASAKDMDCDALLSFDDAQRQLAKAEGLKVLP
ncbi:PIN domain-containing protein [Brevifollis gellanilyticus]|uniref:PIN domain-containing protein n=1 Tax=Brevifollis gellanilyticus TaxID=748831 RepID=A0A512M877_9BACT|nr:PIN domain-containing protein [Brevifollis gellanilyticus]GEP42929.1 hypothetical protein BGE01nite_22200 [Brevifollis gellanilyticus]